MKRILAYTLLLLFVKFNILSGLNLPTVDLFAAVPDQCCAISPEAVSSAAFASTCCSAEVMDEASCEKSDPTHDCDHEEEKSDNCHCLKCPFCHAPLHFSNELAVAFAKSISFHTIAFSYNSPHLFSVVSDIWQPPKLA